jgi:formate--tetrahydrofolate ligase
MVKLIDEKPGSLTFVYDDADELWKKIGKVAKKIYHASEVVADTAVRKKIEKFQEDGFGNLPICIAKAQYSCSTDPQLRDRDRAVRALRRAAEGDCEHRGAGVH